MLERLGGRSAWAGLKNTINSSQQKRAGEPTVVYTVITTRTAQDSLPTLRPEVLDGWTEMSMLGPSRNLTAGGGGIQCIESSSPVLFLS